MDWQNWCQAHPAASSSSPQAFRGFRSSFDDKLLTSREYANNYIFCLMQQVTRSNYDELAYSMFLKLMTKKSGVF